MHDSPAEEHMVAVRSTHWEDSPSHVRPAQQGSVMHDSPAEEHMVAVRSTHWEDSPSHVRPAQQGWSTQEVHSAPHEVGAHSEAHWVSCEQSGSSQPQVQ